MQVLLLSDPLVDDKQVRVNLWIFGSYEKADTASPFPLSLSIFMSTLFQLVINDERKGEPSPAFPLISGGNGMCQKMGEQRVYFANISR